MPFDVPPYNLDGTMPDQFEPWPDNMPLDEQVKALGAVLMEHYAWAFDRSEGAMEKAARLLYDARAELAPHATRNDAPLGICNRCGRLTVAEENFGQEDRMTQPDGNPCGGRFSNPLYIDGTSDE